MVTEEIDADTARMVAREHLFYATTKDVSERIRSACSQGEFRIYVSMQQVLDRERLQKYLEELGYRYSVDSITDSAVISWEVV